MDGETWQVYLVECADHTLYCGVTKDTERRVAQHNGEKRGGARYTRSRRPDPAGAIPRRCASSAS